MADEDLVYNERTGQYGRLVPDGTGKMRVEIVQTPVKTGPLPAPGTAPEAPGLMSRLSSMARQAVLPTMGGVAGGAAGTLAAPFTAGIANPVTGAMAGSAAGEYANQKLGLSEPSGLQVALAGAMPAVPAAMRTVLTKTPGAEAGLQQLASKVAAAVPASLRHPEEYVSQLFDEAKRLGALIPRDKIVAAMGKIIDTEDEIVRPLKLNVVNRGINAVREILATPPGAGSPLGPTGDLTLKKLLPNMQRLGDIYGSVAKNDKPGHGELGALYKSLADALDDAAERGTGPGVEVLKQAKDMFKKNLAAKEIEGITYRATSFAGPHKQINGSTLLKSFEPDSPTMQNLKRWLTPEEIADIRKTYESIADIPLISGGHSGVSDVRFAQRAVVGGALGSAFGGATGAATAVIGTEILNNAMMSPVGRSLIRGLASNKIGGKGLAFDQITNALGQFARQDPGAIIQLGGSGVGLGATLLRKPENETTKLSAPMDLEPRAPDQPGRALPGAVP